MSVALGESSGISGVATSGLKPKQLRFLVAQAIEISTPKCVAIALGYTMYGYSWLYVCHM